MRINRPRFYLEHMDQVQHGSPDEDLVATSALVMGGEGRRIMFLLQFSG